MAEFGVKPTRDESIALVGSSFAELKVIHNLDPKQVSDAQEELIEAFSDKDRHHHAITHIGELVIFNNTFGDVPVRINGALAGEYPHLPKRGILLWLDLYHDFFNNTKVKDPVNVEKSAVLAVDRMQQMGAPELAVNHVDSGIRATAAHDIEHKDPTIAFFLDSDMSILGMPAPRYQIYRGDIKAEVVCNHPEELYVAGRKLFLKKFKDRQIFITDYIRQELGSQANINMNQEYDEFEAA